MRVLTLFIAALHLPYCLVTGQDTILLDVGKPELLSSAETDPNGYHWNNMAPDQEAPNGRLGWINAVYDPAIYSLSLDRYIFVLDDRGWVYVPK